MVRWNVAGALLDRTAWVCNNVMAKSDPKLISRSVVAASAGNHEQEVARA